MQGIHGGSYCNRLQVTGDHTVGGNRPAFSLGVGPRTENHLVPVGNGPRSELVQLYKGRLEISRLSYGLGPEDG